MNCLGWEERILLHLEGDADTEAAEHLRICPGCAALAAEVAEDARALRAAPPEVAAVDYVAIRDGARREAVGRTRRRKALAALAVAAAVLLAALLPLHRDLPQPAHHATFRMPTGPVARETPPLPPLHATRSTHATQSAKPHRRKAGPDLDRQFAEYMRSLEELQRPATPPASDLPAAVRVATSNPNVIIWLQESKGNAYE